MKYFPLFLLILILSCCNDKDNKLNVALNMAGENRKELKKVLAHYKANPADSLKYKAACFLIENMPYHFSYEGELLEKFKNELFQTAITNNCTGEKAIEIMERKYGKLNKGNFKKVYGCHIITAEYLIHNIEFSFNVLEKVKWKKLIDFDLFCESILPYRIGHEPLENWKDIYYEKFQPILDSLLINKNDPLEACKVLYDTISMTEWVIFQNNPLPSMGALNLLESKIGNCNDRTDFGYYVMRALGIPGGIDFSIQYPDRQDGGHSWNFVVDTVGNCVEFLLYGQSPMKSANTAQKKGRVYRKCFGIQNKSLPMPNRRKEKVPSLLNNPFIHDVSYCYFEDFSLSIESPANRNIPYLCVFNNKEWVPIAWGTTQSKHVTFEYVEKGSVYLVANFLGEIIIPISDPILVSEEGDFFFLQPSLTNTQDLVLYRKYPIKHWWERLRERSHNGKFQVSDNPEFENAITLFVIEHDLDMKWHRIFIDISIYRYARFLSGEKQGHCNMAELIFYSGEKKLTGTIIGTQGSFFNDTK